MGKKSLMAEFFFFASFNAHHMPLACPPVARRQGSVTVSGAPLGPTPPQTPGVAPVAANIPPGASAQTPPSASITPATAQAIQLQQYKQKLQQMHQQLSLGQQQLRELQKHPNQQAKVGVILTGI